MPLYQIYSGNFHLTIECPSEVIPDLLACVFSAIIKPASQVAELHYQIRYDRTKLLLLRNGRITHRNRSLAKILYALEWQIVDDWTRQQRNYYLLHAAALAWDNQGYIFVGGPGTGKTSFSIFLMQRAFRLLSDEFACLQPPQFHILPFPRNFIIKPHLLPLVALADYILRPSCTTMIKNGLVVSPSRWGQIQPQPAPLRKIFVLLPNVTEETFDLSPLTQHAVIPYLVYNAFNPKHFKAHLPEILSQMTQQASSYLLESPNPLALKPDAQAKLLQEISR